MVRFLRNATFHCADDGIAGAGLNADVDYCVVDPFSLCSLGVNAPGNPFGIVHELRVVQLPEKIADENHISGECDRELRDDRA